MATCFVVCSRCARLVKERKLQDHGKENSAVLCNHYDIGKLVTVGCLSVLQQEQPSGDLLQVL